MLPVIASSNAFNKVSNYSSAVRSPISPFGNRSNVPCYRSRRVPVAPRRYQTSHYWLVVEPTPLKNMSWSVGMMAFPTEWKNKNDVPNRQPALPWHKTSNMYPICCHSDPHVCQYSSGMYRSDIPDLNLALYHW